MLVIALSFSCFWLWVNSVVTFSFIILIVYILFNLIVCFTGCLGVLVVFDELFSALFVFSICWFTDLVVFVLDDLMI